MFHCAMKPDDITLFELKTGRVYSLFEPRTNKFSHFIPMHKSFPVAIALLTSPSLAVVQKKGTLGYLGKCLNVKL